MTSYAILAMIAAALNLHDWKMLALTALVTAGVFVPVPDEYFYFTCMLGEATIGFLAFKLQSTASKPIWRISIVLIVFHFLGFVYNGYPIASPYHIVVKICEHTELLSCILLSNPIAKRFHNG